jgi:carbonic anhydrase/acetyltransferase-like protein (isoleucine patch superfamily)
MKIPPGSLVVGVPAKVLRPLTEEQARRVGAGAATYVRLKELHRGRG